MKKSGDENRREGEGGEKIERGRIRKRRTINGSTERE